MSYQSSIAEFIAASNKRRRDDEVLQLSDVPGDSPVDLSNEDDGDDTDKEKRSNPEPLSKKKKRIALREQFPWLKEVDCLYYCKVCSTNSIAGSVPDRYSVNKGVPKDKQPGRKCKPHNKSDIHVQSAVAERLISGQDRSIVTQLTDMAIADSKRRESDKKDFMTKYMKLALFLFEEEIPHTTKFNTLVDLVCSFDSSLCHFAQTRDQNAHYRSHESVDDFMQAMNEVLDERMSNKLRSSINKYGSWSLLADESSISNKSFLGVYARFLGYETAETRKELIFFTSIASTRASCIFQAIDESLSARNVSVSELRCVSFDGSPNMSSNENGVYGLMKKELYSIVITSIKIKLSIKVIASGTGVNIGVAHRNFSFAWEVPLKYLLNTSYYNFGDLTFQ